jgi:hypothetical protein
MAAHLDAGEHVEEAGNVGLDYCRSADRQRV